MKNKKIAIVFVVVLLMFFLFSVFFVAHESNHECLGDNCYICEQIFICEKNIEFFGACAIKLLAIFSTVFGGVYKLIFKENNFENNLNLITLKVKMLN